MIVQIKRFRIKQTKETKILKEYCKQNDIEFENEYEFLIIFPERDKTFCTKCIEVNCLHGKSVLNKNIKDIFHENVVFEDLLEDELPSLDNNQVLSLGMSLMIGLTNKKGFAKEKTRIEYEKIIKEFEM